MDAGPLCRERTGGRRAEVGASAIGLIAVVVVLGACGLVAYKFYAAGAVKAAIDKESTAALDRAFDGKAVSREVAALRAFAEDRGCEVAGGSPSITLEPSDNPDEGRLALDCSLKVNLLLFKVGKSVKIEKTRKRSGAFRTIQGVKDSLQRAQDKHDQRLDQRMRGGE